MELRIRQRIFSWTDSYDVYDAEGQPRYTVKAAFFTLGHQIHVCQTATGQEVGFIREKLLTLMPTFEIVIGGQVVGTIRKKFTLFSQNYHVDFCGWQVEGNFLGWDYRVFQGNRQVAAISKELFHLSDTYVLRFADPADEIPGLLLVLAIDAANCSGNG